MSLPALSPSGYRYRTLERGLSGWDIFALQSLVGVALDGSFGEKTEAAVVAFQKERKLKSDGQAGPITQQEVALFRGIFPLQKKLGTRPGLARGQVEKESSWLLGNHTGEYKDEHGDPSGYMDLGLCMGHGTFGDAASLMRWFNLKRALYDESEPFYSLFGRMVMRRKRYEGVADAERRDVLAAGAWNAPAWSAYIAREEGAQGVDDLCSRSLSASSRKVIEGYMSRISVYL